MTGTMTEHMPQISVFIPVYNGGKFLRRTLDSILAQHFADYEVVCVDDSSTDDSPDILEAYARRDGRVRVFRKENGGNVPNAWLFILPHLRGKYVLYCSQDDFMSEDLLQEMHARATATGADATVPCLTYFYGAPGGSGRKEGFHGDLSAELTGREAFLQSLGWDIHAFALWRMELVRRVGFDNLATNSDEYATRLFFLNSRKVVFSGGTFFYNKENPDAITKRISVKRFDWCITDIRLLGVLKASGFPAEETGRYAWKVWCNANYHHRLYVRHRDTFTPDERQRIVRILKDTYRATDYAALRLHRGLKGAVVAFLLNNYAANAFFVRLREWKIW